MKAWRVYGASKMKLDEVPYPVAQSGWVIVKVRTLQISITEVAGLRGAPFVGNQTIGEVVEEKGPLQLFGHEFCGEVVELGEGVENVRTGDRVFYHGRAPCHKCASCRTGHEEYCLAGAGLGHTIPGCLAEYVALPSDSIASIPDSISDSEAAAMQPMVAAIGRVYAVKIEMGDIVVVLGQGVIGRNCMQVSRIWGAGKIIAIARRDKALAVSKVLGADIVINASKVDPVEVVLEATNGVGADIVFECAGSEATLNQAISMVRNEGKIMQPAILPIETALPIGAIAKKRIYYMGGAHSPRLVRYTIDLVTSKRVQPAPAVTHVLKGLDKVPEAFEITGNKAKYGAISPAQVVVA